MRTPILAHGEQVRACAELVEAGAQRIERHRNAHGGMLRGDRRASSATDMDGAAGGWVPSAACRSPSPTPIVSSNRSRARSSRRSVRAPKRARCSTRPRRSCPRSGTISSGSAGSGCTCPKPSAGVVTAFPSSSSCCRSSDARSRPGRSCRRCSRRPSSRRQGLPRSGPRSSRPRRREPAGGVGARRRPAPRRRRGAGRRLASCSAPGSPTCSCSSPATTSSRSTAMRRAAPSPSRATSTRPVAAGGSSLDDVAVADERVLRGAAVRRPRRRPVARQRRGRGRRAGMRRAARRSTPRCASSSADRSRCSRR